MHHIKSVRVTSVNDHLKSGCVTPVNDLFFYTSAVCGGGGGSVTISNKSATFGVSLLFFVLGYKYVSSSHENIAQNVIPDFF